MNPIDQSRLEHSYFKRIEQGDDELRLVAFWDYVADSNQDHLPLAVIESGFSALHRSVALLANGLIPPPELLHVVKDCYQEYLRGEGRITLEEAMQGKPKRHVGSVAKSLATQKRTMHHDIVYKVEFNIGIRAGLSANEAAARAQAETEKQVGWASDSDSWLRKHRRAVKKRPRVAVIEKVARTK